MIDRGAVEALVERLESADGSHDDEKLSALYERDALVRWLYCWDPDAISREDGSRQRSVTSQQ